MKQANIKSWTLCNTCIYSYSRTCDKYNCPKCPMFLKVTKANPVTSRLTHCRCNLIPDGEPCQYYKHNDGKQMGTVIIDEIPTKEDN